MFISLLNKDIILTRIGWLFSGLLSIVLVNINDFRK